MAKPKKTKKVAKVVKPKKAAKPKAIKKVSQPGKSTTAKKTKAAPKKPVLKSKVAKKTASKSVAKSKSAAPKSKSPAPVKTKDNSKVKWSEFVTPLDDRIIVQVSNAERKTAGGLYIPDTTDLDSENTQGIAVSVGRGHRNKYGKLRPMDVRIGDRVVFSPYLGSKIELLGETLILLRESEVMGIVTK